MVKSMKEQQHYDASSPSDKEPERRQTSGSKYPALPTQALRLWSKMMAQYKKFMEIQVMWWTQEYISLQNHHKWGVSTISNVPNHSCIRTWETNHKTPCYCWL